MKTFKRIVARILSLVMIFTTISNTYIQARASELPGTEAEPAEQIVQEVEENVTGGELETAAPPAEEQPVEGDYVEPAEPAPTEPEIRTDQGEGQEFPVGQDPGSEIVTEDQIENTEDVTEDVQPADDGTEVVNEVADNGVIIFYVSGQGGTVSNDQDAYYPTGNGNFLNGSVAIADEGYIFKNWTTEDGTVLSTEESFVPDAKEIEYLTSLYDAAQGQEVTVTYTANFVEAAGEYEYEIPNVIRVKIYVADNTFDREVELIVKHLSRTSTEFKDAEATMQESEVDFDSMMAFDIHFEDVETGEEIEPMGPVKVDFTVLQRAITNTIRQTEGVDEITGETPIEIHHIVETQNARGQVEKTVETIADNTQPENPDTAVVETATDGNNNVTEIEAKEVEINGFSIFVITTGTTKNAVTYYSSVNLYEEDPAGTVTIDGTKVKSLGKKNITFKVTSDTPISAGGYTGKPMSFEFDGYADKTVVAYDKQGNTYREVEQFMLISTNSYGYWIGAKLDANTCYNFYNTTQGTVSDETGYFHFVVKNDNANTGAVSMGPGTFEVNLYQEDPNGSMKVGAMNITPIGKAIAVFQPAAYQGAISGGIDRNINTVKFYDSEGNPLRNVLPLFKGPAMTTESIALNSSGNPTRMIRWWTFTQSGSNWTVQGTFHTYNNKGNSADTRELFTQNGAGSNYNNFYFVIPRDDLPRTSESANGPVNGAQVYRNGAAWPQVIGNTEWQPGDPNYVPEHHKYIKYEGDDKYTLSLDVKGFGETFTKKQQIDVVMVIDLSNSMHQDTTSDGQIRIDALRDAMTSRRGLIDSIFDANVDANVAVVGFSGSNKDGGNDPAYNDAELLIPWVNNGDPDAKYDLLDQLDAILRNPGGNRKLNGQEQGATNIQAGLMVGGETITDATSASRPNAQKIFILLTDGQPTVYYSNGTDYRFNLQNSNYDKKNYLAEGISLGYNLDDDMGGWWNYLLKGEFATEENGLWTQNNTPEAYGMPGRRALQEAGALNGHVTSFYTVSYAQGGDTEFMQQARSRVNATITQGYSAENAAGLRDVFKDILSQMKIYDTTGVEIVDVLSTEVVIPDDQIEWWLTIDGQRRDSVDIIESVTYDPATRKVHAKFKEDFALASGTLYTINFTVYPSGKAFKDFARNNANGDPTGYAGVTGSENSDAPSLREEDWTSTGKPGFYSNNNDEVVLKFKYGETGTDVPQREVPYVEKPVVQVRETEVYVEKHWVDGDNLEGLRSDVTLQLYADGTPVPEAEGGKVVLKASDYQDTDNVWSYTFEHLPEKVSGEYKTKIKYTVTEEGVNEQYYSTDISGAGTQEDPYHVTNTLNVGNIKVYKTFSGVAEAIEAAKKLSTNPLSFKLYRLNGANAELVKEFTFKDMKAEGEKFGISFENIPLGNYYVVEEGGNVDGYLLNVTGSGREQLVSVELGQKETPALTVNNDYQPNEGEKYNPATLKVNKVDDKGNVITTGTARFLLVKQEGGSDGDVAQSRQISTVNGVATLSFTAAHEGTWVLSETQAPEGFIATTDTWTIVVEKGPVDKTQSELINGVITYTGDMLVTVYKNDASGKPVQPAIAGKDKTVEFNVENGSRKINVPVEKIWNDNDDQDGIRPVQILVTLKGSDGSTYTVKLNDKNKWNHTFTDLPEYNTAGTQRIIYTAEETGYWMTGDDVNSDAAMRKGAIPKYTTVVSYDAEGGIDITNTHKPETISIPVKKTWDDRQNQDNIRPQSIKFGVFKVNGTEETFIKSIEVAVNAESVSGEFTDLPKYEGGKPVQYVVKELKNGMADVPANYINTVNAVFMDDNATTGMTGYTLSEVSGDKADPETGFAFTNKHIPAETAVEIHKIWDDENDQDKKRPDEVTVQLYAGNAEYGEAVKLNEGNNWTYTWEHLNKFENGVAIVYSVKEIPVPEGYVNKIESQIVQITQSDNSVVQGLKFDATNSYRPDEKTVQVTKIWDDGDNNDGKRPQVIKVRLTAKAGTKTFTEEEMKSVLKIAMPVATMTADAEGNWETHTWANLPANYNGSPVIYSVEEVTVLPTGYQTPVVAPADTSEGVYGFTITNTYTSTPIELDAEKIWDDKNNQDGLRPSQIWFQLFRYVNDASGNVTSEVKPVGDPKPVVEASNALGRPWTVKFTNLAEYENGGKIEYFVREYRLNADGSRANDVIADDAADKKLNGAYELVSYEIKNNVHTATNHHDTEDIVIPVEKKWEDEGNRDGVRPTSVTVGLFANGGANPVDQQILNAENDWKAIFKAVPASENATAITYTVKEADSTGKWIDAEGAVYDANYKLVSITGNKTNGFTVTNKHEIEKTKIRVRKDWNDSNNQDSKRPDSITVALYADGEPTGKTATLKDTTDPEGQGWVYTWTGLDLNKAVEEGTTAAAATPIVYTIDEVTATGGVFDEYQRIDDTTMTESDGVFTITLHNELTPDETSVKVKKTWDDKNNQDGIRPGFVKVQLFADGEKVNDKGEVLADQDSTEAEYTLTNGETKTWAKLPKFKAGQTEAIVYTVREMNTEELAELGYTHDPAKDVIGKTSGSTFEYELINHYTPEVKNIKVKKAWDDTNNQDQLRKDVKVRLYADGEYLESYTYKNEQNKDVTVSGEQTLGTSDDAEQNAYIWVNVPVRKSGQQNPIVYSVKEWSEVENAWITSGDSLKGDQRNYRVTITGEANEDPGFTVTNSYRPGTIDVTITKEWDDQGNEAGLRPGSIEVQLYADDKPYGEAVELRGNAYTNAGWTHTWHDLDEKKGGTAIVYTVKEVGEADNEYVVKGADGKDYVYTVSYTGKHIDGLKIGNTYVPEKVNIAVNKDWDDNNNQDKKRPGSVTIELYANGAKNPKVVTLSDANRWSDNTTWVNLPKKANGADINYELRELKVPEYDTTHDTQKGYPKTTVSEDGKTTTHEYFLVNVYEPEKTAVDVRKAWSDKDDQDGIRPASVTVQLYADGTAVDTYDYTENGAKVTVNGRQVLNDENGWAFEWKKLDLKKDGKEIVYTVREVSGDTALENGDELPTEREGQTYVVSYKQTGNSHTVTNTHKPEETEYRVKKNWEDAGNQDGVRPTAVKVQLFANGEEYKTATLTGEDWSFEWTKLPKYENGVLIEYTFKEYTSSRNDRTGTWRIQSDYVGSDAGDLPSFDEVYYLKSNYGKGDGVVNGKSADTVTNIHVPVTTEVVVEKIWNDAGNQDDNRPVSITVELYADNYDLDAAVARKVLQGESDTNEGWFAEWTDLIKYVPGSEGVLVEYKAREIGYTDAKGVYHDGVPSGYEFKGVTGTMEKGYTLTNNYNPKQKQIPVRKFWDDDNNHDGLRPEDDVITVGLFRGQTLVQTKTLDKANNWKTYFDPVDVFDNGVEIEYSVYEQSANGNWLMVKGSDYNADYKYDGTTKETEQNGNETEEVYVVANKHNNEPVNVDVIKVWDDLENAQGLRPTEIKVQLLADGNSATTFDGTVIPAETLTGDMKSSEGWKASWTNLPRRARGGAIISYSVVETVTQKMTDDGYSVSYKVDASKNPIEITVTNQNKPGYTSVTVRKEWMDNNNQDGIQPASVRVQLYQKIGDAAEEAYGDPVALHAMNSWTNTWYDLPEILEGEAVTYNVKEVEVPAGYRIVDREGNNIDRATQPDYVMDGDVRVITNRHDPEKTELEVIKNWIDENDKDGLRPETLEIQLYANGTPEGDPVTIGATGDPAWYYKWTDLDKFRNGNLTPISWTVKELGEVNGVFHVEKEDRSGDYVVTYNYSGTTATIDNEHTVLPRNITVEKKWEDGANRDGFRPVSIDVQLLANGVAKDSFVTVDRDGNKGTVAGKQTLSVENNWTFTWNDLERYENGALISYTVEETGANNGENGDSSKYTSTSEVNGDKTTITNVYVPENIRIEVEKKWEGDAEQLFARDEVASVEVKLFANGSIKDVQLLKEENNWSYAWPEMPKYENGKLIEYTLTETAVQNYKTVKVETRYDEEDTEVDKTTGDQTTVKRIRFGLTNTYTPGKMDITVVKNWDDAADQDGIREKEVWVRLYRNGAAVDGSDAKLPEEKKDQEGNVVLDAAGNPVMVWEHTWEDLMVKDTNGADYAYTVKELKAGGNRQTESDWIDRGAFKGTNEGDGYVVTVDGYTITNTHKPEETEITVEKKWVDGNNKDRVRPGSVKVQLLADGEKVGEGVTLDTTNVWTKTWTNLPVYGFDAEGNGRKKIVYDVKEYVADDDGAPTDQMVQASGDNFNGYYVATYDLEGNKMTVTNRHDSEIVKKVNNRDHYNLKQPTEEVSYTVTTAIPEAEDVAEFIITDQLEPVLQFGNGEGQVAVGVKVGDAQEVTLNVDVNGGAQESDRVRAEISGKLLTVTIAKSGTDDAGWSDYALGKSVVVTFKASVIQGADLSSYIKVNEDGDNQILIPNEAEYTIPNVVTKKSKPVTITPKMDSTSIKVKKNWEGDMGDNDARRPRSVTVVLYRIHLDGTEEEIKDARLNKNNNYEAEFTKLDMYEEDGTTLAKYVLREVAEDNNEIDLLGKYNDEYFTSITGYSVTNIGITKQIAKKGGEAGTATVKVDAPEDEFTYTINTMIPSAQGTKSFVVTDELKDELEFFSGERDAEGRHIPFDPENPDHMARIKVSPAGGVVNVNGQTLTVTYGDPEGNTELSDGLKGQKVTITFEAKIRRGAKIDKYPNREVPNDATYNVNDNFEVRSNEVKVTKDDDKRDITVTKDWKGEDATHSTRPGRATVGLFVGDDMIDYHDLNETNSWTWTFRNLDTYDANGDPIPYTVREADENGNYIEGTLGQFNGKYVTSVKGFDVVNQTITKKVKANGADDSTYSDYYQVDSKVANGSFTYKINTWIPDAEGVKGFEVTDTLLDVLEFYSGETDAKGDVVPFDPENADHMATISVKPAGGTAVVNGQTLTVTWGNPEGTAADDDLGADVKGKEVVITFNAKVKRGADVSTYTTQGGIPNDADFKVNNGFETRSNIVRVEPDLKYVTIPVTKELKGDAGVQNPLKSVTVGLFIRKNGQDTPTGHELRLSQPSWTDTFGKGTATNPKLLLEDEDGEIEYVVKEWSDTENDWIDLGRYNDSYVVTVKKDEATEDAEGNKEQKVTVYNTAITKTVEDGTEYKVDPGYKDGAFTYEITTEIPNGDGVKSFEVSDQLEWVLELVDESKISVSPAGYDIRVEDAVQTDAVVRKEDGTTEEVERPTKKIVITWGPETETMKDAEGNDVLDAEGNPVPVDLKAKGQKVTVSFDAKVKVGADLSGYAKYAGKVPNTAKFKVNNDYETDSNTVFVTPDVETINIPVQKVWAGEVSGNVNREKERPGRIVIGLFTREVVDGKTVDTPVAEALIGAGNGWKCEFKDLPKDKTATEPYVYIVKEEAQDGGWVELGKYNGVYQTSVEYATDDKGNVIYANGVKVQNAAITKDVNKEEQYVLQGEDDVFTYTLNTAIAFGEGVKSFTITDKLEDILEFSDDAGNVLTGEDAAAAVKVVTTVLDEDKEAAAEPVVTVSADKELKVQFGPEQVTDETDDLPEAYKGAKVTVSFKARVRKGANVDAYVTPGIDNKATFKVNNEFDTDSNIVKVYPKTETVNIPVEKHFTNTEKSAQPVSVTVGVFVRTKDAEGNNVDTLFREKKVVLDDSNNWKSEFIDLPKYNKDEQPVVYIVKEKNEDGTDWLTLGNFNKKYGVSVKYTEDKDGNPVYKDGFKVVNGAITKEVNGGDSYTLKGEDDVFEYTLKTTIPEGNGVKNFVISDTLKNVLEFSDAEGNVLKGQAAADTVKVEGATPELVSVSGRTLTVRFGPATVDAQTNDLADKGKEVTVTFKARVRKGADIREYMVKGIDNDATYTVNNDFTVDSNIVPVTPVTETKEVPVEKVWAGENTVTNGSHVKSITVGLFIYEEDENGKVIRDEYFRELTLHEESGWKDTFKDLPKYEYDENDTEKEGSGKELNYIVKEMAADNSWVTLGSFDNKYFLSIDGETLTNTAISKDIEGGKRYEVALDAENKTFTYNLTTAIPTGEGVKNFIVTDTLEKVLEVVDKDGEGAKATTDKSAVTVTVDGKEYKDAEVEITTQGTAQSAKTYKVTVRFGPENYTAQTDDLPEAIRGKEVVISFNAQIKKGANLEAYANREVPNKASVKINNGFDIDSNIVHVTTPDDPIDITVEKIWKNDKYVKLSGITVGLFRQYKDAEGNNVDEAVPGMDNASLNEGNNWKTKFEKLPQVTEEGEDITYVVKELAGDGKTWIDAMGSYDRNFAVTIKKTGNDVKVTNTGITKEVEANGSGKTNADKTHADLASQSELFTYTLNTTIPDADGVKNFIISDTLEPVLEFAANDEEGNPVDFDKDSHVTVTLTKDAQTVEYAPAVDVAGKTLTVRFGVKNEDLEGADDLAEAIRGAAVTVTFTARIEKGADLAKYTVDSIATIPNKTTYKINNDCETESNEVTVTPPPVLEKEVSTAGKQYAEHADLKKKTDTFTYKIETAIPQLEGEDLHFVVQDKLESIIVADKDSAKVTIGGQEVKDVTVTEGTVKFEGETYQTLEFNFDKHLGGADNGKAVVITFDAKIKLPADDATDEEKEAFEAQLASYEAGKVPNDARYLINHVPGEWDKATITPPPGLEKEIAPATVGEDGAVNDGTAFAKDLDLKKRDDVFTYKVETSIPRHDELTSFVVEDRLSNVLEIVDANGKPVPLTDEAAVKAAVKVTVGGADAADAEVATEEITDERKTLIKINLDAYTGNKGDAVVVTFNAKIKADATNAQLAEYRAGEIPNDARYLINNDPGEYDRVIVIPPPEIEKEVKADKGGVDAERIVGSYSGRDIVSYAKLAERYGTFSYTIRTEIPKHDDLTGFTITDKLVEALEFVPETTGNVKVMIGGSSRVTNGKDYTAAVNGDTLTVSFTEEYVKENKGKAVEVTFDAKIKANADLSAYISQVDGHDGADIPNEASYTITFPNDPVTTPSNEVNVTPPGEKPEKEVHNLAGDNTDKTHLDLTKWDEVYSYVVKARIPEKAGLTKVTIEDTLEPVLKFVPEENGNVIVAPVKTDGTGTLDTQNALKEGTDYTKDISGKKLTIEISSTYFASHVGQKLGVKFDAMIEKGADLTGYPTKAIGSDPDIPNVAYLKYTIDNDPKEKSDETNTVTVTPKMEYINIEAEKIWEGDANREAARPAQITLVVYNDKNEAVKTASFGSAENGDWKYKFEGLPKYEYNNIGETIRYELVEMPVENYGEPRYEEHFDENDNRILTLVGIHNPYTPGKTRVVVNKKWSDGDNAMGTRPQSVTISLFADGTDAGKKLTLNSENNWRGAFNDLDLEGADGKTKIRYTVEEAPVEGYSTTITATDTMSDEEYAYAFTVENTAENGQLTVQKRVIGAPTGSNVSYTFIITDEAGTEVDRVTINGEGTQTITVPVGVYTVTEVGANNSTIAQYTMTTAGSGQRIRVQAGSEATATIVNTYTPPPTREDPPNRETPPPTNQRPPAPPVTTDPAPERVPIPAQPPIEAGQVLGVRQTDSEQVLGARRGKTGDRSNEGRLMTMMAGGAAALLALLTGRRKRKLEDDDE